MTKAVIMSGSASFEQNRKIDDFIFKKAYITFNVGDGEDASAVVIQAGELAVGSVQKMLDLAVGRVAPVATKTADTAVKTVEVAEKKPRATKTPPVVPPATPAADPLAGPPVTPAAVAAAVSAPPAEVRQISTGENRVDPTDFVFGGDAPEVIPDKDILDATSRKASLLVTAHGEKGTAMLREFGAKFGVKRVSELPQPVRRQYLTELEALK